MVAAPVQTAELGLVGQVAACATYSSGVAKDVKTKDTKTKTVAVKRLRVEHYVGAEYVTVRVRLATTAVGTATGNGNADACPGGMANPQSVTKAITWKGTITTKGTYTASAKTTMAATKKATRGPADTPRMPHCAPALQPPRERPNPPLATSP